MIFGMNQMNTGISGHMQTGRTKVGITVMI